MAEDVEMSEEDDYGSDIQLDDELEGILATVEASAGCVIFSGPQDIEEIVPRLSPIEEFRKKGWLSVSDLVGTIWCEVQYDYRLRTLPFLPPDKRPKEIKSKKGVVIPVDKVKVEDKEKILKRGEKIHKRLEREIHPQEIVVKAVTREDVWGLRFLNMFSALESLLTLGKCRELPVVGFVKGILIMGVIDEITRRPVDESSNSKPNTRSNAPDKTQTSLTTFFSPTKPRAPAPRVRTHRLFVSDSKTRASGTVPQESDTLAGRLQVMMYKELLDALLLPPQPADAPIDDSEDAILPTETPFSWERLFNHHLDLRMDEELSPEFMIQSRPVVIGNDLRFGADKATTLREMIACWAEYTAALGLGEVSKPTIGKTSERNTGRTEERLELVYRRAGANNRKKREKKERAGSSKGKGSRRRGKRKALHDAAVDVETVVADDDEQLHRAIAESLRDCQASTAAPAGIEGTPPDDEPSTAEAVSADDHLPSSFNLTASSSDAAAAAEGANGDEGDDADDAELAWAVEMSLGAIDQTMVKEEQGEVTLRASQPTRPNPTSSPGRDLSPAPSTPSPPSSRAASPAPWTRPQIKSDVVTVQEEDGSKTGSGSIIGRTVFTHSPRRLAAHLTSVLQWWKGEREAVGVGIEETRRCGWCEFEEGCEWRLSKAQEAMDRFRLSKSQA